MESIDDLHLKCLLGVPIVLNEHISIRPKSLREIMTMGYERYNQVVGIVLIDEKESNMTIYQYLKKICIEDETHSDFVLASLQYLLEINMAVSKKGFAFVDKEEKYVYLEEEAFDEAVKIMKIQNCVQAPKKEAEYNPANERARKLIEEIQKNKASIPKPKENTSLHSIISGVAWKSFIGNSVGDLTIYQLYDAYNRLHLIDHYNNVQNGIYTGNIDQDKVNLKDLSWAKIIQ